MDSAYKYHLEPYHGMGTRHECPGCGDRHSFTYYVDEAGSALDEHVGRCDHESGCGYHYTPAQFFADHPERRPGKDWRDGSQPHRRPYGAPSSSRRVYMPPAKDMAAAPSIDTIPFEYVERSASYKSAFIQFLCKLFDVDDIRRLMERYALGATNAGDVIYWQIDSHGQVRGGKIIKYDADTGHRIKDGAGHVDWVHSRMKKAGTLPDSWSLSQCLFGEHLLRWPGTESQSIALVESEKSALIGAAAYPQYIWMATGGIGNLTPERMEPLKGRTIIIFPDVDGTAKWEEKAKAIRGSKVIVSHILEEHATPEERAAKIDLADWIIRSILEGAQSSFEASKSSNQVTIQAEPQRPPMEPNWSDEGIPHLMHQSTPEEEQTISQMKEEHPAIGELIEGLGLQITGFRHFDTDGDFRDAIKAEPNGDAILQMIDKAAAKREQNAHAAAIVNNNKLE